MPGTNAYPSTYYPGEEQQPYPAQSPGFHSQYTAGGFVFPGTPGSPGHQAAVYPPVHQGNQTYPHGTADSVMPSHGASDYSSVGDSSQMQNMGAAGDAASRHSDSTIEPPITFAQPGKIFMFLSLPQYANFTH